MPARRARVEEELSDAISSAKAVWQRGPKLQQLALLPEEARPRAEQMGLDLDTSGISDEVFWESVEERVFAALRDFAAEATERDSTRRRLFVEDAEGGFAFIDLCRKRFDVVLMNPPFGEASSSSQSYVEAAYPRSKNDVLAAFVEMAVARVHPWGLVGAITSRTAFFLSSFQKWRQEVVLGEARPTVFADLGYGVMDTAMVEAAAYCLEHVGNTLLGGNRKANAGKIASIANIARRSARALADVT